MKLTLKLHQLLQAIAFATDDDIANLDMELTLKELQDGVYVWRAVDPSKSFKLEEAAPAMLLQELYADDLMLLPAKGDQQHSLDFGVGEADAIKSGYTHWV